jgi:hypothetical protein
MQLFPAGSRCVELKCEDGQGLTEYELTLAFVAIRFA